MKILKFKSKPVTAVNAIAAKIRAIRLKKGLSKISVAKSLGMSVKQYAKLESGQTMLWLGQLFTICELLDIEPVELLKAGLEVIEKL